LYGRGADAGRQPTLDVIEDRFIELGESRSTRDEADRTGQCGRSSAVAAGLVVVALGGTRVRARGRRWMEKAPVKVRQRPGSERLVSLW